MSLLIFLSVLLTVVIQGLGQSTQKVYCNKDDQVACLRAELSAVKVTVDQLKKENTNLKNEVQICSQAAGSDKWLNGGHKSNKTYNEVITQVQLKNNKSDLYVFYHGYRMSVINGQLWVTEPSNNTIQILDPYMNRKINEITVTDIRHYMWPRTIKQTNTNQVLMGAGLGLFVLDIHGTVLYKVAPGLITDIAIDFNKAYAYNLTTNSVATVSYNNGQWVITNTFIVSRLNLGDNYITLLNNQLYISSYFNHNIQTYSVTGTYLNTYGIKGSNSPGQLYHPNICGTDSHGAVLICDQYNDRLQVLSSDGTWQVYVLEGVTRPFDVLTDISGNMWVRWGHNRLSKFSV